MSEPAIVTFLSKTSSAGVVNVMLGFQPDYFELFIGIDQTNPTIYHWANKAKYAAFLDRHIKQNGADGVITKATTGTPTIYAGGDDVVAAETTDTDGKHVGRDGLALTGASANTPIKTKEGITIPAALQVAGALNMLVAWRGDR